MLLILLTNECTYLLEFKQNVINFRIKEMLLLLNPGKYHGSFCRRALLKTYSSLDPKPADETGV